MSIFPHRIEKLIGELRDTIPPVREGLIKVGKIERHDWRPVWEMARRIQSEFNESKDFASPDERQRLWGEFNRVRERARELQQEERTSFAEQSGWLRDEIMRSARACIYHPFSDVLFFFDRTRVDEMKQMASLLKEVGRRLSENKQWMTTEDKQKCFALIQEARESQDAFWEKRRELSEERREATARRREEGAARHAAWREKIEGNITRNREKLAGAREALERTRERIRETEDKLAETTSEKWSDIFSGWLSEARTKEADIEASIERLEAWIRDDQGKLDS